MADASFSPPNESFSQQSSVGVSQGDTKQRKSGKRREKSLNNETSSEPVFQVGAFSVVSVPDDPQSEHAVVNSEMKSISDDIESPEPSGTFEHAIEAHIVDDSLAGLEEDEKEKYEKQTRERLLAEIAGQAAIAEVVFDEEQKQDNRSFLLRGCLCVMVAMAVAITTGVVVSRKTASEGSNELAIPSALTLGPSGQPSLMPTSEPLNNTYCEEAHPIFVGQNASGSLKDAITANVVYCEDQSAFLSSAVTSPGRWYWYRGEGFPIALRGDEFVDINVHLSCTDAQCVQDVYYRNPENDNAVLWEAKEGTDYMVLVSAADPWAPELKTFTLTIERNDVLENAFGPLIPGLNTVVGGSTVGTKVSSDIPECGSATVPSGPGVWYSVIGNGKVITASTCGSPTGLDTQISVFSTENMCVDGNDDFCNGKSQVAWLSNVSEIYFVLVHGKDGAEGTFILQLTTEGSALADADFCANAKLLEVGSTEPVDLTQATIDPDLQCSWENNAVLGNFYTFLGTGRNTQIFMNTTVPLEEFPYYLSPRAEMLTGPSCSMLECIANCNEGCQVSTILGQSYYVYVYYLGEMPQETERHLLNQTIILTIEGEG